MRLPLIGPRDLVDRWDGWWRYVNRRIRGTSDITYRSYDLLYNYSFDRGRKAAYWLNIPCKTVMDLSQLQQEYKDRTRTHIHLDQLIKLLYEYQTWYMIREGSLKKLPPYRDSKVIRALASRQRL